MEMKQTWLKKLTSSLLAGALALGMAVVPAAAAESNKLVEVDLACHPQPGVYGQRGYRQQQQSTL